MRVAVNSHALPIYKKNRIASLLCIVETTIVMLKSKKICSVMFCSMLFLVNICLVLVQPSQVTIQTSKIQIFLKTMHELYSHEVSSNQEYYWSIALQMEHCFLAIRDENFKFNSKNIV